MILSNIILNVILLHEARGPTTTSIKDYSIKPDDPPVIRKALSMEFKTLKQYVLANDVEALYTSSVAQRNGDRIVKRFTEEFKEYSDVEDMRDKKK